MVEALTVAIGVLIVIVLLKAGHGIVLCLMRWAPSLALGALVGGLAHSHGLESLKAFGLGAVVVGITRRLLRPRFMHEPQDWP